MASTMIDKTIDDADEDELLLSNLETTVKNTKNLKQETAITIQHNVSKQNSTCTPFVMAYRILLFIMSSSSLVLIFIGYHHQAEITCVCPSAADRSISGYTNFTSASPTSTPTNIPSNVPSNMPTDVPTNIEFYTYKHYVGDYKISAQTASHENWLLCDGSFLDPRNYTELFNIIGYSFGNKRFENVKRFALPNPNNHVIAINGDKYKMGDMIGKENIKLNNSHIPYHSHSIAVALCYDWETRFYAGCLATNIGRYTEGTIEHPRATVSTGAFGNGSSFEVYQPTIHIGNLFIYGGDNRDV